MRIFYSVQKQALAVISQCGPQNFIPALKEKFSSGCLLVVLNLPEVLQPLLLGKEFFHRVMHRPYASKFHPLNQVLD